MKIASRSLQTCLIYGFLVLSQTIFAGSTLQEPAQDERTFQIQTRINVTGTLKTPAADNKTENLALKAKAEFNYRERKLPAGGREARALRGYRQYSKATSTISVAEQQKSLQLNPNRSTLIAEGGREGIQFYSPETPLTRADLDLVTAPADPLSCLGLLVNQSYEVGDKWSPSEWSVQMLTGIEALTSSSISCELKSAENQIAIIQLSGDVKGATLGSLTDISLDGTISFDLKNQLLIAASLVQKEKREIGTVSPGMDVTANISWTRGIADQTKNISTEQLANIPLDPPVQSKELFFRSRHWDVSFTHDRDWHIFQEIPQVTVLRLVDSGALLSQCNIARIQTANPGEHVAPEKFENDIRNSLGTMLNEITESGVLATGSDMYIHRVIASGETNEMGMLWIYYLCANPDGRQLSFVFALEKENQEELGNRDLALVTSLKFADVGMD